jgi:hypothetical protein
MESMARRREFLKSIAGGIAAALLPVDFAQSKFAAEEAVAEHALPAWEPGALEIHHLDTGRGNATLVLGPDGTSFLIDAGEAHSAERTMSPARPDASLRAGEWIARYVRRQLDRVQRTDLDVMLLSHLHGDHVGEVTAAGPLSGRGGYRLTGAADVAESIHVAEVIDRGWPDYSYPVHPTDPSALNFIALARSMAVHGTTVQRARAGSADQLALRKNATEYPHFSARVLAVNGDVLTGRDDSAKSLFPALAGVPSESAPTENMCCIAILLRYGNFRYYTGGDLTCDTSYGRLPWHDIETPVAEAAGAVSVAVANHHGYFDACGPAAVRALQPRVWVLPTWHVSHPDMGVLSSLFSEQLYPGPRLVFATGMAPAALLTTERFSSRLASNEGHVVLRVSRDGREFKVYVVSADDEGGNVKSAFGPFAA